MLMFDGENISTDNVILVAWGYSNPGLQVGVEVTKPNPGPPRDKLNLNLNTQEVKSHA